MFGNIRKTYGEPEKERKICDMEIGESGYSVTWVVQDGTLNLQYSVGNKGGTRSMKVTRLSLYEFDIEYEKPIYRNIFTGEYSESE